jgi:hypothetical protein
MTMDVQQGTNGKASAALRAGRSLQRASAVAPRTASTDSVRAAASRPAPTPKVLLSLNGPSANHGSLHALTLAQSMMQ